MSCAKIREMNMTQGEKIDKILESQNKQEVQMAVLVEKMDTQIDLQKKTNGRVTDLECESDKRKEIIGENKQWHKTRKETCPWVGKFITTKQFYITSIIIGTIIGVVKLISYLT